jgi:23S rRNA (uracil-5-)-methyltransferase RumA
MIDLKVGDKIRLDIRKQGINGEGIGYYHRLAIFVPGAIVKETVDCEIVERHKKFAFAKLNAIVRESTRRVDPPCRFYGDCGGCQMQHIDYTEQLKIKQSILKQAFARYTPLKKEELNIKKTLGMDEHFHYRNKSQMPFNNTNFGLALGLYKQNSNHFVYVDECLVQTETVNAINQKTLSLLRKNDLLAYDHTNREGILLNLVTRHLSSTDQASVTFIVRAYDERLAYVARELMDQLSVVKSVSYSVNTRKNIMMFGDETEIIAGKPHIYDDFDGLSIRISPDAFHQLNSGQTRVLYDTISQSLDLSGDETIVDAYSGIGITTLMLARQAKHVYGIDYSGASIRDAKANAEANGIDNVTFIARHVEGAMPRFVSQGIKPDIVVVDPPRKGLDHKVINALMKLKPKKIIYVSCNPSTLAKNYKRFHRRYRLASIQPIDMFPHTSDVESVNVLIRRNTEHKRRKHA